MKENKFTAWVKAHKTELVIAGGAVTEVSTVPTVKSEPILRIIYVREHLRNLPQGHHPSVLKIAEAAESGIELAENQTIVSAHPRCCAA